MMAVTLAPNALTTLETVKAMLGIPLDEVNEQRDVILINLINAVSAWVERMIGRKLGKQEYVQRYAATGAQEMVLQQWPILAVAYIRDLQSGEDLSPDRYDFHQDSEIGVIYKDEGWPLRGRRSGLAYDIVAPSRSLEVKYTAGYVLPKDATEDNPATLPYDLQQIVWGAIGQEFDLISNGAQGLASFSIADVSWTFDKNPRESWLKTLGLYTRL